MITISHNHKLEGIDLEEVMDTLGVKKTLSLDEKNRCQLISEINEVTKKLNMARGKKAGHLSTEEFDCLYDQSAMVLVGMEQDFRSQLQYLTSKY